ncbi:synapse-associated protein [Anaeramoeba flamelloides]|uniref:Synapse-associated protein n=1 Tax=Anaeramoeba flamelloides TaxID=1746091 RepID=A0ABQ8YRY3_9EUKA|nr:synapse-associated protein [Anaeramoeba flamelloides]
MFNFFGFGNEEKKTNSNKQRFRSINKKIPPWKYFAEDHTQEKELEESIKRIAHKSRFFDPKQVPENYYFDLGAHIPLALSALECDLRLSKLRYHLVPKVITERLFWRCYFFKVYEIVKQSEIIRSTMKQKENNNVNQIENDLKYIEKELQDLSNELVYQKNLSNLNKDQNKDMDINLNQNNNKNNNKNKNSVDNNSSVDLEQQVLQDIEELKRYFLNKNSNEEIKIESDEEWLKELKSEFLNHEQK